MVLTPTGRLIRRSAPPEERTSAFAAQFSLSHNCWLLTYPLAGWLGAEAGPQSAVVALGAIALTAGLLAVRLWPTKYRLVVEHEHTDLRNGDPYLVDAVRGRTAGGTATTIWPTRCTPVERAGRPSALSPRWPAAPGATARTRTGRGSRASRRGPVPRRVPRP
ncbi:hypothetical protein ACFCX0_38175 [Streptomyces sp. NPDC056352]|uniref:hypothetical protein n=1 Tax=Streptomyces sp. NPDC056352 TaxID=3345791 RepID=UPI0035E217BA